METYPTPKKSSTRAPKKITPRLLSVLRRLATGQEPGAVCREYSINLAYLNRCLREPHIRTEYDRLTRLVEQEFVAQAATGQATVGSQAAMSATITSEVDASILESIQKLRSIMNTSPSHQAQALAAKELLDLGQAKKRLALLDKGLEDGVEVSADDISLLASTVADLRTLHLTQIRTPSGKDTALRRFSASEEEIEDAMPEEMLVVNDSEPPGSTPDPIAVDAPEIAPIATLGNGPTLPPSPGTNEPAPITGPTLNEMLGG